MTDAIRPADIKALARTLAERMLLADLLGRVHAWEAIEAVVSKMNERSTFNVQRSTSNGESPIGVHRRSSAVPISSFGPLLVAAIAWQAFAERPLKPLEAIKALRARIPMTGDEFYALRQAYRQKGFAIAGADSAELVTKVQQELGKALAGGITKEQFLDEMPALFERMGVAPASRFHMETVFTNAMQSSYNAGRWSMQTDPDVKGVFAWQYDAVDDDRTRPTHRAMDGVTRPPDDPIWQRWYPPNGHRCRCRVITVPMARASLTPPAAIPHVSPDPGWASSPASWL